MEINPAPSHSRALILQISVNYTEALCIWKRHLLLYYHLVELTQAFPACWSLRAVCKMEPFQITPSLCFGVGSPVAPPAISPQFPNTLPLAWRSGSREQCPPSSLANSWVSYAGLLVMSNCANSSDSHAHNYVHTGTPHPAFVFSPPVVFKP